MVALRLSARGGAAQIYQAPAPGQPSRGPWSQQLQARRQCRGACGSGASCRPSAAGSHPAQARHQAQRSVELVQLQLQAQPVVADLLLLSLLQEVSWEGQPKAGEDQTVMLLLAG